MSKRKIDIEDIDGNFSGNVAGGNVKEKHTTYNKSNNPVMIVSLVIIFAIFVILVIVFIITSANKIALIADTPTPTLTNTPIPPTATNTSTPTPTNTPIPPTVTNSPTPIPTPTNTPMPTDTTVSVCNLEPGDSATIQIKKKDGKIEEVSFSPGTKGCASVKLSSSFNNMSGIVIVTTKTGSYAAVIDIATTTIYFQNGDGLSTMRTFFPYLLPSKIPTLTPTPFNGSTLTPTATNTPTSTNTPVTDLRISVQIETNDYSAYSGKKIYTEPSEKGWVILNDGGVISLTTYFTTTEYLLKENEYYDIDFLGESIGINCLDVRLTTSRLVLPDMGFYQIAQVGCKSGYLVQGNSYNMQITLINTTSNNVKILSSLEKIPIIYR